ncbi:uncharacterized protein B0T23DRAFT_406115 [Neurospora hispaniola]|uniref:Uncharacterized protein n=1 Tax=Neurospora hispaniola TaxID=588809 RepID=A0AAJ0MPB7_9PEZI|nr:hypothetical protein B0T23DRAFT_406115 [Neurospora hispaniola]
MIANCPRTFALFLQFSDSAQLGVYGLRTASTIGSGPPAVRLASFCSTAVRVQITSARPEMHEGVDDSALRADIDAQPLLHTSRRPGWVKQVTPAIPRSPAQQSMAPAPSRLSTGTRFFWNVCDPGIPDLGQDPCPNAATLQRCSVMFVMGNNKHMALPVFGSHPGRCALRRQMYILANGCVEAGTLSDRPGDSWTMCGSGFTEYSQCFVLPSVAEGILMVDARRTRRRTDTSKVMRQETDLTLA